MRKAFIEELCRLAAEDERIWLLTADLGYGVIEPFAERFPDRFVNVGVAEQNMIGAATGIAKTGAIVFCWSITPFALLRPLEFIKCGPVLHKLPVHIVGTGIGKEYETAGSTHWLDFENVIRACAVSGLNYWRPDFIEDTRHALKDCLETSRATFIHLTRKPGKAMLTHNEVAA